MKSVLFLAYLFPPISNSGTQRPWKFAKYLSEYGWRPTVMTAANFDGHHVDQGLAADLPADVRIVRVPMLNEHVAGIISRMTGGSRVGKRVGDAVSWRMRSRRTSPDLYALWKPMVMRKATKLYEAGRFDAIYATGFPWTSLVTGCELSKATGCPLIADFRDLWAGETLFSEDRPPHDEEVRLERGVVECATTVVTASETIGRQLASSHPAVDEEKFVAIHNGFDAADFADEAPRRAVNRFRIVYTGVWKDGYNPGELYDTIDWIRRSNPQLLDGVEIIAAGFTPGEARRRGLSAPIEELGVVSHDAAVELMRSADILYLSHANAERQWAVPGKVYEYLASGAPVLALTPPDKETGRIISRVGGGVAVSPDDPGTLLEVLTTALRHKRLAVPPRNADALAAFERRQLTAKLASVLDGAARHVQIDHTALRIGARSSTVLATRSS
jgi:glycosyltransferase involved in cell wall biosynthesis